MKKLIAIIILFLVVVGWMHRPTYKGIDVSHHNSLSIADWQQLRKEGVRFCYVKASEGTSYKDPQRRKLTAKAHGQDMLVGAYHFFHSSVSAEEQYHNFQRAIDFHDAPTDLYPAIDFEENGLGVNALQKTRLKELAELMHKDYDRVVVYCNPLHYVQLKSALPSYCIYWVSGSVDFLGTVHQHKETFNGREQDFNYTASLNTITKSIETSE